MSQKIINQLKPIFISYLHNSRIETYIQLYKQSHNGRRPSQKEINAMVAMMVAQGTLEKDAEGLAKDFIKEIRRISYPKHVLSNVSIAIPLCGLLEILVIVLLLRSVPDYLRTPSVYVPLVLLCILTLALLLIHVVKVIAKD